MPHSYAPQFRTTVVEQVRSGRTVAEVRRITKPFARWRIDLWHSSRQSGTRHPLRRRGRLG